MKDLNGKVAVITGAGSGLGREFARLGAREGMKLVLADVQREALDAIVAELGGAGAGVIGEVVDVADSGQVAQLAERAFHPRQAFLQHDKTRAGNFRRGLEIHQPERLAKLEMLLGLEVEFRRRADFAQFLVGGLVADRDIGSRHIGDGGEQRAQLIVEPLLVGLALLDGGFQRGDLIHEAFRGGFILAGLGLADLLGGGVAAGLSLLQFLNRAAALLVQAQNSSQGFARLREAAIGQPFDEGVLIVADPFDIEHGYGLFCFSDSSFAPLYPVG